jgi:bacteriocin-like protein
MIRFIKNDQHNPVSLELTDAELQHVSGGGSATMDGLTFMSAMSNLSQTRAVMPMTIARNLRG